MLLQIIIIVLLTFLSLITNFPQLIHCAIDEPVLVKLSNNKYNNNNNIIVGKKQQFLGKDVNVFLGIPYARAPVGELRFKKPVPIVDDDNNLNTSSHTTIRNASQMPSPCVNYIQGSLDEMPWSSRQPGSEDCLYLNIWSPDITAAQTGLHSPPQRSVMVWIYGGAFQTGSIDIDAYDGQALATVGDVVVVTFNYRTGVFGLFYDGSGTDEAPGNLPVHDQRLALSWIQKNIDRFGGDPQSVTLFGESAGSISIGLHLLSVDSGQLFKRAILQSGSPYHNIGGVSPELAVRQSRRIAADANCLRKDDDHTIDLNCMRQLTVDQLMDVYTDIYTKGIALQLVYGDDDNNKLLPRHPIELLDNYQMVSDHRQHWEVLLGTNRNEGASILFMGVPELFARHSPINMTKAEAIEFIRASAVNWWLDVLTDRQLHEIIDYYMSTIDNEDDYPMVRQSLANIVGDSMFNCPSLFMADQLSKAGGVSVWYYHFSHIKQFDNHWGQWMGSPHFDEVQYVFGLPLRYPDRYTPVELQLSINMMKSWSSFASNG
ncbi:cholinesterase 1-like [Oppia nitens]|uniref:cholinesterase 1-like n=1 Tax=Oppia nitens TaxID=1686743 RepID=UPI0023DA3CD0|nr:cholinesterase 1-like [Oppia nitens]